MISAWKAEPTGHECVGGEGWGRVGGGCEPGEQKEERAVTRVATYCYHPQQDTICSAGALFLVVPRSRECTDSAGRGPVEYAKDSGL